MFVCAKGLSGRMCGHCLPCGFFSNFSPRPRWEAWEGGVHGGRGMKKIDDWTDWPFGPVLRDDGRSSSIKKGGSLIPVHRLCTLACCVSLSVHGGAPVITGKFSEQFSKQQSWLVKH